MKGDELKDKILKEMGVGMFAALASETPDPYVSEVDEDYNEVEGETPDGETAEGNINRKSIRVAVNRAIKARNYVNTPTATDAEVDDERTTITPPFDKNEANYLEEGSEEFDPDHKNCQSCAFYVEGGGCLMVQGEIDPEDYCTELYSDVAISGHKHGDEGEEVAEEVTVWGDEYDWEEVDVDDFSEDVAQILRDKEGLQKVRSKAGAISKARVYVENPEEVPEGFEPQEGQQGGIYYEPVDGGGDFTQEEWEEAGLQILEDFDEDDYRFDYWEGAGNSPEAEVGTIVTLSDEEFALEGDIHGVVVDADNEAKEFAVVTEDGEMVLAGNQGSMWDGDMEYGVMETWDSPDQDNIRTGWDREQEREEQRQREQQEIEEGERAPYWADEDPFKDITDSDAPEGGLEEGGLYYYDGDIIELERDEDYEGDVDVYQHEHFQFSSIDGILCRTGNPNDIKSGEVQYIDFSDDVDKPDGWYQVADLEEDEDGFGWEIWNSEEGILEIDAEEVMDTVEGVHQPRENFHNFPGLEDTPEPSGSTNPDDWTIDWEATDSDKSGRNLPMAQKKLLMREWKSAVDTEAAESVSQTIRDIKDSTYNTQGQKYDKLIKAVMGAEGEPRSDEDFEDAEEPTEEEIEAMKVLQDASQKFFETRYGDSKEVHRGLAKYSHKNVLPQIFEMFQSGDDLSGTEIELDDNPSGVWSTEAGAARAFTIAGSGLKSLKVSDHIEKEDVFNMPDAIYPYEEREEVASDDSDWDEGEVNTPSNGKRISSDDIEVVNVYEHDEEGNVHQAPLNDVLHNPEKVLESENTGAINRFLRTLDSMHEEFYESYKESLQANEAVTGHEEWEAVEEQIDTIEYDPSASVFAQSMDKEENDIITLDLTGKDNSDWLNTTTDYVLSEEQEKARRYINDPSEAPEGVEVQEGPRGGYYYEDEAQAEIDDFTDTIADPEPEEDEEVPPFYDSEINEYVLDFMEQEGIDSLAIPEDPDFDQVKDAEETWDAAMDYFKEHMDEMDDKEEGMAVVTFAANRRDEMRVRRNRDNSSDRDVPETPDPVAYDEIQESYDFDQVPDTVPGELEEMYAVADMSDSYRQFANTVTQNGLLDISNRQLHRFGRAFSSDEEYEVDDLTTLPEGEMSALAQGDLGQETMRRIQEARQGEEDSITMYRAVPEFVDETAIGDYVALNPEYAQRHGEKVLGGQQDEAWHVIEDEVPIEDVVWPGEAASEFVYSPKEYRERWSSLKEFYQDANSDDTKSKILKRIESLTKERVYVENPNEAPEGVQVQEGDQGGIYYETEDLDGDSNGEDSESSSSPEEIIEEYGLDEWDEIVNTMSAGILEGADLEEMGEKINEEVGDSYMNRLLRDVLQGVDKNIEGFDSEAKLVYDWENKEFPQEAEEKFKEAVDEETFEIVNESVGTWELEFFEERMAPLWQTVMEETGNSNLLNDEENVSDVEVSDEEKEAILKHKEFMEDILREQYGDSITLYRGFYGEAGNKLDKAGQEGEEVEMDRRALESYTTELSYAKEYVDGRGGAIIKEEFPVEDVWASSHTGFLTEEENEFLVSHDESETIDPENILTIEDMNNGALNYELVGEQIRDMLQ